MYTQLDGIKEFLEVDEVLIENQPSLLNPTMKTISALLYGYFTLRGIVDKEKTNSNITNIRFIAPSNKLKINKETTDKTLEKAKTKREEYMMTKDLGKKYCKALIAEDKKHLSFVESVSKHDDLCDAFLQGFYYLFINNMPQKYIEILNSISKKIESNKKEKKGIKI
jgi:vacuolar-type H+-ATPase subunit B/Vma2